MRVLSAQDNEWLGAWKQCQGDNSRRIPLSRSSNGGITNRLNDIPLSNIVMVEFGVICMLSLVCRSAGLVAALAVVACARAPEAIAPAPVNATQFQGMTCGQLATEEAKADGLLVTLASEQSQSRTDDAIGFLTVLMPIASMSGGDLRHQIALQKGRREAAAAMLARNCSGVRS